jgi:hypothetical protein
MSAIILESSEFAYLLAMVNAESIPGIHDPALFPSDISSRDSTFSRGLQLLKENGWIKPADKPSQFDFNESLLLMAAVIADPEFIVFTIRLTEGSEKHVIMHFVEGSDIVEMLATNDGKYHMGFVPDLPVLYNRIKNALEISNSEQQLQVKFFTDEKVFKEIKSLISRGHHIQATQMLEQLGLGSISIKSLTGALNRTDWHEIIMMKTSEGELMTGRKASLFQGDDCSWLARRLEVTTTKMSIETVQDDTISNFLKSSFSNLNNKDK